MLYRKVEFRTPEILMTDEENVSTASFVLMTYHIASYQRKRFNFYLPMTRVKRIGVCKVLTLIFRSRRTLKGNR
jgi:hypothetical protein